MKKLTIIIAASLTFNAMYVYAANKTEVIIPGDQSHRYFRIDPKLKEGEDYLPKTIIFKLKPEYRQNAKMYSVDNLLPLQDFLQTIGEQNLAKLHPDCAPPSTERNAIGQKLVDLSLIYSFRYTADTKLEKAINQLLSTKYFEYVEPWYVPKLHAVCSPNDPNLISQYHLQGNVVGSIDVKNTAWCVTNGSASVVIGIVDTGTEFTHPDLAANLLPGWDVAMNDNDPTWQGNNHGVHVCGDASAVTNNGTGVSGAGWGCKLLPVKVADASGALVAAYQGITWAANNGAKIINCSWGGGGGGSYGQNIIDYAVINQNCLVLASAGNGAIEEQVYPSSYNNVYRVAASNSADARTSFSSYGLDVDFCSPGQQILSTVSGGGYQAWDGTSMASPVAAGAAGLIQSFFNYTNATQIGEKLKQTCDILVGTANSTQSLFAAGKLGKGRIDVNNALTQAAKSLAMNPINITDGNDNVFMPNETLSIRGRFTNYLDPSSSTASAVLTVVSGPGTVLNGNFTIGALPTLDTTNNNSSPFTVSINSTAAVNAVIKLKVTITDGAFTGVQYFDVTVNVDYINITINDVFTTITSKGRIGYNNDSQVQGLGFQYQLPTPSDLLYEMSLMIGTSATKVSDMFRGTGATGDVDFGSLVRVAQLTPAAVSDFDVNGKFNDAPAAASAIPVEVRHSAYAWATTPYRKFVIVKYVIKNTGASTLSNLYAGIIADWDVPNAQSGQNRANYDAANKMGYVWNVPGSGPYAAIKLLSNTAGVTHYAIDNTNPPNNGGVNVATASGFTTALKYTVLSTNLDTAGTNPTGRDVMSCVSSGPFTVNTGDSITVAFALIGGDNLTDIQNTACYAQQKWDNTGLCAVGINEVTANNFNMDAYPNPASGIVNINYNFTGSSSASLKIINSLGKTVMTVDNLSSAKNTIIIDVSQLSAGNYFYQLKAGEAILTKKFAIVR